MIQIITLIPGPPCCSNLLTDAGLRVESCPVVNHAWSLKFLPLKRSLPDSVYRAVAWLLAVVKRRREVIAVCTRSAAT
jgi:hypothetical protein